MNQQEHFRQLKQALENIVITLDDGLPIDVTKIGGNSISRAQGINDPGTQRVCISDDDTNSTAIKNNTSNMNFLMNSYNGGVLPAMNVNLRGVQFGAGANPISISNGNLDGGTIRVCAADDDTNLAAIRNNTFDTVTKTTFTNDLLTDVWDSGNHVLQTDTQTINGNITSTDSGNHDSGTQRVTLASNDVNAFAINTSTASTATNITNVTKVGNQLGNVFSGGDNLLGVSGVRNEGSTVIISGEGRYGPLALSGEGFALTDSRKIGGTIINTNTGTVGAGTQRVTIATDDTNMAATASGVQSLVMSGVNVSKLASNNIDISVGNKSTGTQRVTIATDDTNLAAMNSYMSRSYDEITARIGNKTGVSYCSVVGEGITIDTVSQTLFSTAHTLNRNLSFFPQAGVIIAIASTSANDTVAGTGARTVLIEGLDASYVYQTDQLNLNGTTKVSSVKTYTAITRLRVVAVGSTGFNQGDLYIGADSDAFTTIPGIPNTDIYFQMGALHNAALCATFTVPAGYSFLPIMFGASSDATSAQCVRFDVYVRPFLPIIDYKLATTFVSNATTQFRNDCTAAFRQKSTVYIKASTASGTCNGVCTFQGLLLNNTNFPNIIFL